jgi:hypothetical protein
LMRKFSCKYLPVGSLYICEAPADPKEVMKYFRLVGAEGGKARARNHSPEELSRWGKLGGRPKGSTKAPKGEK